MAWTRARIEVDRPREEVFPRVADFSHLEEWDPGIVRSQQLGTGPVREGTEFELVARFLRQDLALRYQVTELRSPERLVLEAESTWLRAVDRVGFEALGPGRTAITWEASLMPKGVLYLGALGLHLVFQWMGRRAMDGLTRWLEETPAAATRGAGSAA